MKKDDKHTLDVGTRAMKIGGFDMGKDNHAPRPPPPTDACVPGAGTVSCSTDHDGTGGTCRDALTGTLPQPDTLGMSTRPSGASTTGTDRRRGISSVVANFLGTSNGESQLSSGANLGASGSGDEDGTSGPDDEPCEGRVSCTTAGVDGFGEAIVVGSF